MLIHRRLPWTFSCSSCGWRVGVSSDHRWLITGISIVQINNRNKYFKQTSNYYLPTTALSCIRNMTTFMLSKSWLWYKMTYVPHVYGTADTCVQKAYSGTNGNAMQAWNVQTIPPNQIHHFHFLSNRTSHLYLYKRLLGGPSEASLHLKPPFSCWKTIF